MANPISFDAYLGWADITNPDSVPADARLITAADLLRYENLGNAAEAFSAQVIADLALLGNTGVIKLRPQQFTTRFGAPSLATGAVGMPHWALDAAAQEGIIAYASIPASWASYDVVLVTANLTAGAGNVRISANVTAQGLDGAAALGAMQASASTTHTAPGNLIRKDLTAITGVARTGSGEVMVRIDRLGADAADTLAADYGLLSVELRKVS